MNKLNLLPVIETFKTVENMGKLDMTEAIVQDKDTDTYHECGTVHCVAGWYAVAKLQADSKHPMHGAKYINYRYGIDMINEDAGLDLKNWAKDNPDLWGNPAGDDLWHTPYAWTDENISGPRARKDLTDIIEHLERVQSRIDNQ